MDRSSKIATTAAADIGSFGGGVLGWHVPLRWRRGSPESGDQLPHSDAYCHVESFHGRNEVMRDTLAETGEARSHLARDRLKLSSRPILAVGVRTSKAFFSLLAASFSSPETAPKRHLLNLVAI